MLSPHPSVSAGRNALDDGVASFTTTSSMPLPAMPSFTSGSKPITLPKSRHSASTASLTGPHSSADITTDVFSFVIVIALSAFDDCNATMHIIIMVNNLLIKFESKKVKK